MLAGRTQKSLIALTQVMGLTAWFSATAVVADLRQEWNLSLAASVWLTSAVQVGFVLGAVASSGLNLSDRVAPQRLFAFGAMGAAACTALLSLSVHTLAGAIMLRALTGVFLAGVYPVGLKLMASWAPESERGRALGILVGALTLGSGLPYLISGLPIDHWRAVLQIAALITAIGGFLSLALVRPGPQFSTGPTRLYPRFALTLFRLRRPRLINLAYLGHMWELYALWTWLPIFLMSTRAGRPSDASSRVLLLTFLAVGVAGAVGCLLGGMAADRFGRTISAATSLGVSGTCCLLTPFVHGAGTPIISTFALLWGAAVIADSGVFSTALSESIDAKYVGTALTIQTATGFLLTTVSIQLVQITANVVGWQYAFTILAVGPIAGVIALISLSRTFDHDQRKQYG